MSSQPYISVQNRVFLSGDSEVNSLPPRCSLSINKEFHMLLIAHYEAKNRGKRFKLLRDTFSMGYSRFASKFVSFFAKFTTYSW